MLTSHVDATGKASTSQKRIEGVVVKPVARNLLAPLTKCKISAIDTSVNRSSLMSMHTVLYNCDLILENRPYCHLVFREIQFEILKALWFSNGAV